MNLSKELVEESSRHKWVKIGVDAQAQLDFHIHLILYQLGKNFSWQHFEIFFYWKQGLTFLEKLSPKDWHEM